jgi:RNA polymerase sigma factor (sigma-70 family)
MEPLANSSGRTPDAGRVCPPPLPATHDASDALTRADEARPPDELALLGELEVCYRDTVLFRTGHLTSHSLPFLPRMCDSLPGGFAAVLRQQSDQILALAVRVTFHSDSAHTGDDEGDRRRAPDRIDKYGRMALAELLLHRGHRERMFRWLADESDAEDIVQDAVTKLLSRGLGNYTYPHPVAPYLRRVVLNRRTDLARTRQRQARAAGDLREQAGPGGPEEEAIRHEVVAAVGALREELTGDDRRVLDLLLEGTTIKESADRLEWPVSRAYARRCKVRDLLEARFRGSCVCAVSG